MISNVGLRDKNLSFKAKGLLAYMLSLPDDWVFYESEITKHATDGKHSVRAGLQELESNSYLVKNQSRDESGKFSNVEWILHDEPLSENRSTDNPPTEKPTTENQSLLNTDLTNDLSIPSTDKKKSRKPAKADYDDASPYMQLAKEFFSEIQKNNSEAKEPNYQKWADDIRKLVELDGKSLENVRSVMAWSQKNNFWKGNILSAKKLREKYDQLKVQSGNFKARKSEDDPSRFIPKELRGKEQENGKGFGDVPISTRQTNVSASLQSELEDFI